MLDLLRGFSDYEASKITLFLQKLLPYLKPNEFVIVGGLAIRYHLISHKIPYPKRSFNDLDLIAKDLSVVSPSIVKEFLIYHFHYQKEQALSYRNEQVLSSGNEKTFFLPLVDPITKIKIDIFDFNPAPSNTLKVRFNGHTVNLVSIEDQLVKTVFDLQRISQDKKVDPKQFSDCQLLLKIADLKKAEQIWKSRKYDKFPNSIIGAIKKAEKIAKLNPEWLKEKPFRRPKPYVCPDCKKDPRFPLTPMKKIYQILGYVE